MVKGLLVDEPTMTWEHDVKVMEIFIINMYIYIFIVQDLGCGF